jgi:hypothetical protein
MMSRVRGLLCGCSCLDFKISSEQMLFNIANSLISSRRARYNLPRCEVMPPTALDSSTAQSSTPTYARIKQRPPPSTCPTYTQHDGRCTYMPSEAALPKMQAEIRACAHSR